jgi:predicted alpha/beta-fold hydrolase
MDFDEYYTAPIHGFKDAKDYYDKSNSKQFLEQINIPAFLINALDDPFLSDSCHPFEIARQSKYLHFIPLNYGGHVGFIEKRNSYFSDQLVLNIIDQFL